MGSKKAKQVMGGAALSYILIVLNAIYGLVLTPYILGTLGPVEYGVYKTIGSLSSSLLVIDLGLGATVTRYVAKYNADKEQDKIPNFMALIIIETGAILAVLAMICMILYLNIPKMYSQTFTSAQVVLAKKLFLVLSVTMACTIIENIVNGAITGENDFVFGNGVKLLQLAVKIISVLVLLPAFRSAIALVMINLVLSVVALTVEIIWARTKHKIRVKFTQWDKALFSESFVYSGLMFASSIINQVNGNLDNVVIGALMGAAAVTVYSMGITIYAMFEQLSTAISGVMLPSMMDTLAENDGMKKAQQLVVRAGRAQFCLLGAALGGFATLGHEFVWLWLGNGFEDVYTITMILMIPSIFTLCVNVCLSILRAKNMLGFRTIVLLATTVANAVITYWGTKRIGYIAACLGTAFSLIVGVVIIMNIYYHKKFGFNMIIIYRDIFRGIWMAIVLASCVTYVTSRFVFGSWWAFVLNVIVFCILYGIFLLLFALNSREKDMVKELLVKKFWA